MPLAGVKVSLSMWVCNISDHAFAVASADMVDPARVGPALRELGDAARRNIDATVQKEADAIVPGMTPHPLAKRWELNGRRQDGQPVREQLLVFAHGARVFQVAVIGAKADDAIAAPLFNSLRVIQ